MIWSQNKRQEALPCTVSLSRILIPIFSVGHVRVSPGPGSLSLFPKELGSRACPAWAPCAPRATCLLREEPAVHPVFLRGDGGPEGAWVRTEWMTPETKNLDGPIFNSTFYSMAQIQYFLKDHFSFAWRFILHMGFLHGSQSLGGSQEAVSIRIPGVMISGHTISTIMGGNRLNLFWSSLIKLSFLCLNLISLWTLWWSKFLIVEKNNYVAITAKSPPNPLNTKSRKTNIW